MAETIFAYTGEGTCPEFVNITFTDEGGYRITVRGPSDTGNPAGTAVITLTPALARMMGMELVAAGGVAEPVAEPEPAAILATVATVAAMAAGTIAQPEPVAEPAAEPVAESAAEPEPDLAPVEDEPDLTPFDDDPLSYEE